MKKTIFIVLSFTFIGCTNPSMEEGLTNLKSQLAEIEEKIVTANIEGMEVDITSATIQIEDAIISAEVSSEALEESLVTLDNIKESLVKLQVQVDLSKTVEQIAEIKEKLAKISKGVALLVFRADYDYDGVMNGLDDCPDTPITEIKSVDDKGCSPSQLDN